MSDRPHRAAVIGCGRIAYMLEDDPLEKTPCTHMGAYLALPDLHPAYRVEVVAASDTDEGRLQTFLRRFGVAGIYKDYKKMLRAERPDIVSVCAWATERFPMVMASIEAGAKGIWCEKAFATSLEEGRLMEEAALKNNVKVLVSHMRRWSREYRKAKEMIDGGMIGEPLSITAHFSGSLVHTGTHAFDVMRWFAGEAEWVEGEVEGRSGGFLWDSVEDLGGEARMGFKNGMRGYVLAEPKDYFIFEFDIIGTRGRIRIGNNEVLEYYAPKNSAHYTGLKELYREDFPAFEPGNWWVGALKNLIDSIEGRAVLENGPADGNSALEMAFAIHESSMRGGSRVHLPLSSKITVRSR